MAKITIQDIKLPIWEAVRRGSTGQELIIIFTVDGSKFRCVYIQEHYYYGGLPGTWTEHCTFQKIREGEVISTLECGGEFRIPHAKPFSTDAYSDDNYRGDDHNYLYADKKTVSKYIVEPFVKRYF